MKNLIPLFVCALLLIACKDKVQNQEDQQMFSTEMPENQVIEYAEDDIDNNAQILEPFNGFRVLEYLKAGKYGPGTRASSIKYYQLVAGDTLRPIEKRNGEGTFKVYALEREGKTILEFQPFNNKIRDIEVLDKAAVPEGMIAPGNTLAELQQIYPDAMPFGSEVESRVYVQVDNVSFLMDARHPKYESLNLYPSTKILSITFSK